jgi:hypothetical protein
MKKTILLLAFVTSLLTAASAQDIKVIPAYWVVETNVNQKNFSIVRMYDAQHNLVHEVKMEGIYLNVSKAKHRKMLDQLLKGYYPMMSRKERLKMVQQL